MIQGASGPYGGLNRDLLLEMKDRHPNLKALNLSHNSLVSTEGLGILGHLEKINLSNNHLSELSMEPLMHLKELEAGNNSLVALSPSLAQLPALTSLDLSDNQLTLGTWLHTLAQLPALRKLRLSGNPVCTFPGYAQLIPALLPQLEELDGIPVTALQQQPPQQAQMPGPTTAGPLTSSTYSHPAPRPTQAAHPSPLEPHPTHTTSRGASSVDMAAQNQQLLHQLSGTAAWLEKQVMRVERANERDAVLSSQLQAALGQLQTLHSVVRELQGTTEALQAARIAAEERAAAAEAALARALQLVQAPPPPPLAVSSQSDHQQPGSQAHQLVPASPSQRASTAHAATSLLRSATEHASAPAAPLSPSQGARGMASRSTAAAEPTPASHQPQPSASAVEIASLQAHVSALQRVISVQEQELARQASTSPQEQASTATLLQNWRAALEQEAHAATTAEQNLAQQRQEWRARIEGVQQQFEAAQSLLTVLEQRGAAQKAEVAQVKAQCAKLLGELAQERQRSAEHVDAMKAIVHHVTHFSNALQAKLEQVHGAAATLQALAARVKFAQGRLRFAMQLARQGGSGSLAGQAALPQLQTDSAGSTPLSIAGRMDGAAAAGAAGSATSGYGSEHVGIAVLQEEIRRLAADRDSLIHKLAHWNGEAELRVKQAVAAVRQQEEQSRGALVEAAVQKAKMELHAHALQAQQEVAVQRLGAQQELARGVASLEHVAQAVEAHMGLAVAKQVVRLQDLQAQLGAVKSSMAKWRLLAANAERQVADAQTERDAAHREVTRLQGELQEVRDVSARQVEDVQRGLQDELEAARRRAVDAEREAARSVVLARQVERQLVRLREQRVAAESAAVSELNAKLEAKEEALRTTRRERNALLAVLRKHGIVHLPAAAAAQVASRAPGAAAAQQPRSRQGGSSPPAQPPVRYSEVRGSSSDDDDDSGAGEEGAGWVQPAHASRVASHAHDSGAARAPPMNKEQSSTLHSGHSGTHGMATGGLEEGTAESRWVGNEASDDVLAARLDELDQLTADLLS